MNIDVKPLGKPLWDSRDRDARSLPDTQMPSKFGGGGGTDTMKNKVRIKSLSKTLGHWRIVALGLMVCDFGTIHLSYFLALWYRFGCVYSEIPAEYLNAYGSFITPYAVGSIVVFLLFRMYRSVWRYVSYDELLRTFLGSVSASVGYSIITTLVFGRMPVSYYLWGGVGSLDTKVSFKNNDADDFATWYSSLVPVPCVEDIAGGNWNGLQCLQECYGRKQRV